MQTEEKQSDEVNNKWALNLTESTLNRLRLHLSWTMGINTFDWDRHNVGEQTIITLKKLVELCGPLCVVGGGSVGRRSVNLRL